MKRITEMDEAEVLALTEEQINKLVDYECALEGAPMLPPAPGSKPTKTLPEADATVFKVGGYYMTDAGDAAKILAALESTVLYEKCNAPGDYSTIYLSPLCAKESYYQPKIESERAHSPAQWDTIKSTVAEFTGKLAEWEKLNKAYSTALKARADISAEVYRILEEARDTSYNRTRLREEFARYLELAEGNRVIALNFLQKAKGEELDGFPELSKEFLEEAENA